jgi:hypothetical protein
LGAWRFENSNIASGDTEVQKRRLLLMKPTISVSDSDLSWDLAVLDLLRRVEAEIETTGRISGDLKEKNIRGQTASEGLGLC